MKKVNAKSLYFTSISRKSNHLAPAVKTLDGAIQRTNNYPANSAIGFPNTCPLDSDLFGG